MARTYEFREGILGQPPSGPLTEQPGWFLSSIQQHLSAPHQVTASLGRRGTRRSLLTRGVGFDVLYRRRQRHSRRLEHRPAGPFDLAPQQESLPVLFHLRDL